MKAFHRLSPEERRRLLVAEGRLSPEEAEALRRGESLPPEVASAMVENVIGVHALPLGVLPEIRVNGRTYRVPMAIEEPSVVAAASHAARIAGDAGGIEAEGADSVTIGQIHLVACRDPIAVASRIEGAARELLDAADAAQPGLAERGGGARALEVRRPAEGIVVVHLLVDCIDAMGANAVNTAVEALAPRVEALAEEAGGGRAALKILSNLADRRVARARVRIPEALLEWHGFPGAEVARGVAEASLLAEADPYRAATHNKGIMNGVDAAAIATGNDWRAIEAGAHAFAARSGRYAPLARWRGEAGCLLGTIEMPMSVGTVGGSMGAHPGARMAFRILGVASARELSAVLVSVGLVQNLAALKALATEGIQRGHMARHARSVAAAAGAREDELEELVGILRRSGEIRPGRAREELASLRKRRAGAPAR